MKGRLKAVGLFFAASLCSCASSRGGGSAETPPAGAPDPTAAELAASGAEPRGRDHVDCPRATSLENEQLRPELDCLLAEYVRIDTTNPPGGELLAANFLQNVLSRDGLGSEVIEVEPGRANWVARIEGQNHDSTTVLLHHIDAVVADAKKWDRPPFSGEIDEDELWGRGAFDNKGAGITQLLSVVVPLRSGRLPTSDVLLVGVADEEAGGGLGARWLLERRPELFRGGSGVLSEGGAILELAPNKYVYSVEVAQKAPLWLQISASGKAGHGSTPSKEAASHTLIRALGRLEAFRFPVVVVPEVQEMFSARAAAMPPEDRVAFRDLQSSLKSKSFREEFLQNDRHAALVRNTVSITMLSASDKENVLGASAVAVLDVRLLPGQHVETVTERLKEVMGEPSLEVKELLSWEAQPASTDTALFRQIEQLARQTHPGAPVAKNVIGGFTDCNAFRAHGLSCYGFLPLRLEPSSFSLLHAANERSNLADLAAATRHLATLLRMEAPTRAKDQPKR